MSHGSSRIRFTNSYGKKLWVAYCPLDHNCGTACGDPWIVKGWIGLDPGETETRQNPTENRWFYYYAEAEDGAVWAGPYVVEARDAAFSKCTCIGVHVSHGPQPYYDVGMRELDTVEFGGLNFIP